MSNPSLASCHCPFGWWHHRYKGSHPRSPRSKMDRTRTETSWSLLQFAAAARFSVGYMVGERLLRRVLVFTPVDKRLTAICIKAIFWTYGWLAHMQRWKKRTMRPSIPFISTWSALKRRVTEGFKTGANYSRTQGRFLVTHDSMETLRQPGADEPDSPNLDGRKKFNLPTIRKFE